MRARATLPPWLGPAACLLAFALRMVNLAGRPLWYDEAFAVLYAALDPGRMVYGTVTPAAGAGAADVHPLFYYFLLHIWMGLAGRSPLAVRFLSVMLGMVTVALLARLARWCFGRRTGLTVALLAAVNPFHVAYSQEARMYALLGLAAVTTTWGLLRALEPVHRENLPLSPCLPVSLSPLGWWLLYALAAACTLYAHNLGALVLLALNLLAVSRRRWRRSLPALLLADLGALALFGPWLVGVLPGQVGFVSKGYWLAPPGAAEAARALMQPVLTFYEPAPAWVLALGLFAGLLLVALLALRIGHSRSRAGWFLLLWGAPIVLLFAVSQWRAVYLERALLPSALFLLVAAGWLLSQGWLPSWLRLGLAALLGLATAGSLWSHVTYSGFPRPPFPQAAAYLEGRLERGDVVVHTNKLTYFPMRVYAPQQEAVFLADPPGSPQATLAYPTQEALGIYATATISEAADGADQLWLVYFPREVAETEALLGAHPALSWLEGAGFVEAEGARFGDLVVALYRREGP